MKPHVVSAKRLFDGKGNTLSRSRALQGLNGKGAGLTVHEDALVPQACVMAISLTILIP